MLGPGGCRQPWAARRLGRCLDWPENALAPSGTHQHRGQKLCLDADEVEEELELDGRRLRYVQVEASFSQPNAAIAAQMLGWAHGVAAGSEGRDLLELYCGNGNFTAALAPRFRKVVATELSKASVAAARRNFALNGVDNVFVARMRSEEFTEAWHSGKRMERCVGEWQRGVAAGNGSGRRALMRVRGLVWGR